MGQSGYLHVDALESVRVHLLNFLRLTTVGIRRGFARRFNLQINVYQRITHYSYQEFQRALTVAYDFVGGFYLCSNFNSKPTLAAFFPSRIWSWATVRHLGFN